MLWLKIWIDIISNLALDGLIGFLALYQYQVLTKVQFIFCCLDMIQKVTGVLRNSAPDKCISTMSVSLPGCGPSSKYLVTGGPTVVPFDWTRQRGAGILRIGTDEKQVIVFLLYKTCY